ncbi:MAG TPA: MerR family transcriptional regulator, partial [Candidatus Paceibacterota bacterium]|nr:MerR family transcriptional regulator [Candidatus Paceibacterota bacterium]
MARRYMENDMALVDYDPSRTVSAIAKRFQTTQAMLYKLEQRGLLGPDRDKNTRRIYRDEDLKQLEIVMRYLGWNLMASQIY